MTIQNTDPGVQEEGARHLPTLGGGGATTPQSRFTTLCHAQTGHTRCSSVIPAW